MCCGSLNLQPLGGGGMFCRKPLALSMTCCRTGQQWLEELQVGKKNLSLGKRYFFLLQDRAVSSRVESFLEAGPAMLQGGGAVAAEGGRLLPHNLL